MLLAGVIFGRAHCGDLLSVSPACRMASPFPDRIGSVSVESTLEMQQPIHHVPLWHPLASSTHPHRLRSVAIFPG